MSRIALIGCGTIGAGWAVAFARAGHVVTLYDMAPGRARQAMAEVEAALANPLVADDPEGAVARWRLSAADSLSDAVGDADYVQESAPEDIDLKTRLFAEMETLAPEGAILASSSSAIMPSKFMVGLRTRRRCLVAHPFNPPYLMPLVEVVPTPWTDETVIAACADLLRGLGQSPVVLRKEIEGFVGNRLQAAVVNEAMYLVGQGVITPEGLDRCMRDGLGRRWAFLGPFETMDLNAPAGFADYAAKFGDSYQDLGKTLGVAHAWTSGAVAAVEAWRRAELPASAISAAQAGRDRALALLSNWLGALEIDNPRRPRGE